MFSSGFGFLSYLQSTQNNAARAIDRDNYIETNTAALVLQIQQATFEDETQALINATEGLAFRELSDEINRTADLFVQDRSQFDQQLAEYRDRNAQIEVDRIATAGAGNLAAVGGDASHLTNLACHR
ncbi:hypothetical protein OAN307_c46390 [Octadecabacter antarcticus 307]|uniref:Uncharacterized protein n=1 Tax=Octadecabacter antarcticus 307 TaxID=391626 RepID=M9RE21_9RHOB|nr:hypothetical protein OAN307_c46390 [Octadecabacter antarcticus 307]